MNRRLLKTLLTALFMTSACPALAAHGPLSSTQRDAWINTSLSDLVSMGLVSDPGKPVEQLTNFQVAGLTAQASQLMAQANGLPPLDMPPALPAGMDLPGVAPLPGAEATQAAKSLEELVEEFKEELQTLGIDVDKLEDKLSDDRAREEVFAALQKEYLKRTGTDVNGFSRGYMYNYRGFGADAAYPEMDYNAAIFMEMDLKSVPVPDILFDARLRFWRSIGMYYQDPIQPEYQLRWLALSNTNEVVNFTAGDFFKSYTPLTLWDSGAPVYTLIEPTSFYRNRMDTEELVYMNQAPDWHMRGFQLSAGRDWSKDFLSGFALQAMAGTLRDATPFTFSSYYAGSEDSVNFLGDNLEFKGVGMLMWQDPNSANVPYLPDFPSTFAKQYQIGSLDGRVTLPFADQVNLTGTVEKAFTQYDDDSNNPQRVFEDWGIIAKGSLNILGAHFTAKYLSIGPYFYSPGAQTNAYTPVAGFQSYLSTNMFGIDDALPGYLNNFPLQDVNRPSFAPYDRLSENMLPYGDATPNREGTVLGFSADIGQDGWLKPQASYVLNGFHEIQPDNILGQDGVSVTAVDGNSIRTFGGYEAALTVSLDKALSLKSRTYDFQFDYKHQTTDLGDGVNSLTVNTLILATDFTIPVPIITPVIWSAALEQTTSAGSEYVLGGVGNPTSLANYPFFLDNSDFNNNVTYNLQALDLTRTTLAFGFKYPLSDSINFRGDYFFTTYNWPENPGYQQYDNIWRFTYEAHF